MHNTLHTPLFSSILPGLLALGLLHDGGAGTARVGWDGLGCAQSAIRVDARRLVAVAHHEDVVAHAEGVPVLLLQKLGVCWMCVCVCVEVMSGCRSEALQRLVVVDCVIVCVAASGRFLSLAS